MTRVVITGMGAVTALGTDVASTWTGLVAGRSGIATIQAFDPSRVASKIAGEVKDFDASHVLDRKDLRRTDRYIQLGLVAARSIKARPPSVEVSSSSWRSTIVSAPMFSA